MEATSWVAGQVAVAVDAGEGAVGVVAQADVERIGAVRKRTAQQLVVAVVDRAGQAAERIGDGGAVAGGVVAEGHADAEWLGDADELAVSVAEGVGAVVVGGGQEITRAVVGESERILSRTIGVEPDFGGQVPVAVIAIFDFPAERIGARRQSALSVVSEVG